MMAQSPARAVPKRVRAEAYVPPPLASRQQRDLVELLAELRPVSSDQGKLFSEEAESRRPSRTCYISGDLAALAGPCVSIVGTREVSPLGANRARRLARELVAAGVTVVSGLARGVDTEALTAAIGAGGRTVAVIGTPLDRAFPIENARLQERIYREQLLVSPFADGTPVQKHFFPIRNRVMAALSDATVIVEASDTSGTLHQAAECQRLGRWLFIARSVAEDSKLAWPKRFLGQPKTAVLANTEELLARLR